MFKIASNYVICLLHHFDISKSCQAKPKSATLGEIYIINNKKKRVSLLFSTS